MSKLDEQVGGNHYKNMVIQPIEFCYKNNIPAIEAGAIGYICRHKFKNGKQDLLKAIHLLEILIEFDYPEFDPDTLDELLPPGFEYATDLDYRKAKHAKPGQVIQIVRKPKDE
jgi:hypothetical protein